MVFTLSPACCVPILLSSLSSFALGCPLINIQPQRLGAWETRRSLPMSVRWERGNMQFASTVSRRGSFHNLGRRELSFGAPTAGAKLRCGHDAAGDRAWH